MRYRVFMGNACNDIQQRPNNIARAPWDLDSPTVVRRLGVGGVKGIDVAPYRSLARRRLQRPRSPLPGARHPAVNVPLTVAVPTPRTKHTLTRVRRYPLTTLHVVSTQIVFIPRLSAVSDDNYSSSSTPSSSSAVGGRISVLRYAYSSCVLSLSHSLARSLVRSLVVSPLVNITWRSDAGTITRGAVCTCTTCVLKSPCCCLLCTYIVVCHLVTYIVSK